MSSSSLSREIKEFGAAELVGLMKTGQLQASEVLDCHLERINEANPAINAIVWPLFDEARRRARELDDAYSRGEDLGPLHGIPFTVKESIQVANSPSTLGLSARIGCRDSADAVQVMALRRAGGVLLGKTNTSLLLKAYESNNPVYGRTNNPWNLGRAPGGSSGGEAAIVAVGGSALGLGSDLSGSIRLPAHACGVHGLRPTSGRLTLLGHTRIEAAGLNAIRSQPGPLARHVEDLGLAMRVLAAPGHEQSDPAVPPVQWKDSTGISHLRIGFYCDNGIFKPCPAVQRAVRESAIALQNAGAELIEWQPISPWEAWELQLRLMCADGLAGYRRALRTSKAGRHRMAAMPSFLRSLLGVLTDLIGQKRLAKAIRYKKGMSLTEYSQLLGRKRDYSLRFTQALATEHLDALICPPDALPALLHGSTSWISACTISYAGLYSLLGMPAGVAAATRVRTDEGTCRPKGGDVFERAARHIEQGSSGLPIGVQVAARQWREDIVISIMSALECHFRRQADYPSQPPSFQSAVASAV